MGIDGIRNTGPLTPRVVTANNGTQAAEAPQATATTSNAAALSSDSSAIPASKLEAWAKNYQSATPENIGKIKDAFQEACGRQPTDYEIERALTRADIRGMDDIVNSIKTSTEAAVRKYGSQIDSLIEETANSLRASGQLDEDAYNSLKNNPDRKAFFADWMMQGQSVDQIKGRLSNRLEAQDLNKLKEKEATKPKEEKADPLKDTPTASTPGKGGKVDPTTSKATEKTDAPKPAEKTITVGGSGMGGSHDTSFNVTPGELAAMYDILKDGGLVSVEDMQKQLKELYGIDTEVKGKSLVTPDGRTIIADTNGNGILDMNDMDFNNAIQQVKQEFGIDITKGGRLSQLEALAKTKGLDNVLAIFERSRQIAQEAEKAAEKARSENRAIDAATQAKLEQERASVTKDFSQAIEDNLGYDVAGEGATGKFVGKGEDPEKDLHAHENDTVNFHGDDGKYENVTMEKINEEVKDDPFAGLVGDKHDDPVSAAKKKEEPAKADEKPLADTDAEETAELASGE